MTDASTEYPGYELMCPWHHRQPFDGVEQFPCVIAEADAVYQSWAPAPGNSTPSWLYVSTERVNSGVFYVQPGGWFDPGNHPGPEPYYILQGTLHLGSPDTGGFVELSAGDASNIPALAYHHAWNFGSETCVILWWVPGEMHTDEFKRKVSDRPTGDWRWYEREPVMLNGSSASNDGFPSRLRELSSWPSANPPSPHDDMWKLDRTTWLHTVQGSSPRLAALVSFFYCDERIRCAELRLPQSRETDSESGEYEKLVYVKEGDLSVNLPETGESLRARPGELAFLPPGVEHRYQALGDGPLTALIAFAYGP